MSCSFMRAIARRCVASNDVFGARRNLREREREIFSAHV